RHEEKENLKRPRAPAPRPPNPPRPPALHHPPGAAPPAPGGAPTESHLDPARPRRARHELRLRRRPPRGALEGRRLVVTRREFRYLKARGKTGLDGCRMRNCAGTSSSERSRGCAVERDGAVEGRHEDRGRPG